MIDIWVVKFIKTSFSIFSVC